MKLRLAGIKHDSIVDGPGIRTAVFVQGCSHKCPGCHNPENLDPAGGFEVDVSRVADMIAGARGADGITFTGGEPFEQAGALLRLTEFLGLKSNGLVMYSGYTYEQLLKKSLTEEYVLPLLKKGLLLIDGPFQLEMRDISLAFRGSANQRIIDLPRSLSSGKAIEWVL